jgi:hypothetical protein
MGSASIVFARGRDNVFQVRAYDLLGNEATSDIQDVWVNRPPIAVIRSPDVDGNYTTDEPLSLDATGSLDPDGDEMSFEWFLDGSDTPWPMGRTSNAQLTEGRHTIRLVIRDPWGGEDSAVVSIDVHGTVKKISRHIPFMAWVLVLVIIIAASLCLAWGYQRHHRQSAH